MRLFNRDWEPGPLFVAVWVTTALVGFALSCALLYLLIELTVWLSTR